ncbi:uncharacterized protein LOC135127752 [Zophobas morio]|uniref:uncharacterized protein LOC135127752 n=1 Tax=Zophobas morio TaxID=2755281 RepID=UPI003083C1DC
MLYVLLIVIGASFIEQALSLQCYVSNTHPLSNNFIENTIQDCDPYLTNAAQPFGAPDLNLGTFLGTSSRCYTMQVTTSSPIANFALKGCVPAGLCDFIVRPIAERHALERGVTVVATRCDQCAQPHCNL